MTEFYEVKPNEWQMPIMKKYKMACCDCGLVHNIDFKVIDNDTQKPIKNGRVLMKATRNNKLTKELKKKSKMGKIKIKIKAYGLEHALTINDEVQAS